VTDSGNLMKKQQCEHFYLLVNFFGF